MERHVKLIPKEDYLAVKTPSALLRGITSKHHGNFYCLNCLHSFATEQKLESHKNYTKILQFNQYQKSDKAPFIIYADLECIIEKIDGCKNNPENSFTVQVSEHIPSGFSMSTISSLRCIENKHDLYRSKDCIKRYCKFLRKHAIEIIIFLKKNETINKRPAGII